MSLIKAPIKKIKIHKNRLLNYRRGWNALTWVRGFPERILLQSADDYVDSKVEKKYISRMAAIFTQCHDEKLNILTFICSIILLLAVLISTCVAENLFVRNGAKGKNNGLDWDNAWSSFSRIVWGDGPGRLGPGDILWIGGGEYTDPLIIKGNGIKGSPITIKRANARNSECTSASGWDDSIDSQVVIHTNATGIYVDDHRDWIVIDGQVSDGIKVIIPHCNGCDGIDWSYSCSHWEIRNIEFAGPNSGPNSYQFQFSVRGLDLSPPTSSGVSKDIIISKCKIHGIVDGIFLNQVNDSVIEYNKIYNINSSNPDIHCNVLYVSGSCNDITFRYNNVWNYSPEGLFFSTDTTKSNWKVYGNLFHDGPLSSTARVLEVRQGSVTNLQFYNNTLAHLWAGLRVMDGATLTGDMKNNIMYDVKWTSFGDMTHDYNFSNSDLFSSEPHGISNGENPFLNQEERDYHILVKAGTRQPKDRGVTLGPEFCIDMDSKIRGKDGFWDIGAFEAGMPPSAPHLNILSP